MSQKKSGMTATGLRGLLIFLMILVIAGSVAGFYYGLQMVREYAVEVSHTTQDAAASDNQFDQLQALRQQLAQTQQLVKKANQIFTTNAKYQSQAVTDFQAYAKKAGVTIDTITFPNEGSTSTTKVVSVTLEDPVEYKRLIHFLQLTETSLPKLQTTSLSISRNTSNNDTVDVAAIKFNMSVK